MAGLETKEKRIGDAVYRVHKLPYGEARPLIWLGASVILPAFEVMKVDAKALLTQGVNALLDANVGVHTMGEAFRIFFDRATEADFVRVEELFTKQTFVHLDGEKAPARLADVRDTHWPGRYPEFLQWLAFSIEVHFGPFSRGPSGAAGAPLAVKAP